MVVLSVAAAALAATAREARGESALLAEARFTDHCLERPVDAEALYLRALEKGGLAPKERAEARYSIARARGLDGRREAAAAVLEPLANEGGDPALGPWPSRARRALDQLGAGLDPFAPDPRGSGVHTVEATATSLTAVLRDLGAKTGISFALDRTVPERWTVSAFLSEQPLDDLLDKLIGKARWRRVADGVIAVGDTAANGERYARGFEWAGVEDAPGRALGARLATTRVTLNFAGLPLAQAAAKVTALGVCDVRLDEGANGKLPVRLYAKDCRLDHALDLLTAPLGLLWVVEEGRVHVRPRPEEED
jgi:hypothetical protein